ncbi:MAG: hypothetical protein FWF26_02545 [Treponema sp.]|nr:hypothetical protein [Treponema sp.]
MILFKKAAFPILFIFFSFYPVHTIPALQLRSLDEIFPGLDDNLKSNVFSENGYKHSFKRNETQSIIPNPDSGIDLYSMVMEKNPSHFVEALIVFPYNGTPLGIPDAYNALGKIGNIKNYSYINRNRNMNMKVYEESTRIESAKKNKPVPDPPPEDTVPAYEQIFLVLKDRYFGNMYFRGEMTSSTYGLTFNLTNFKAIRYFLIPVMKAEKFCAILYLEPVKEGMLVYCMAAVDIPNFFASRINISGSVERRLNVFIDWLKDGLDNKQS